MARGNHGREIFRDDRVGVRFLETLGEACAKTGWRIHAYVLSIRFVWFVDWRDCRETGSDGILLALILRPLQGRRSGWDAYRGCRFTALRSTPG